MTANRRDKATAQTTLHDSGRMWRQSELVYAGELLGGIDITNVRGLSSKSEHQARAVGIDDYVNFRGKQMDNQLEEST